MAIITSVPAIGSIVKGSPATFTLSKAQLLLVPSVAGSTYYSDSGNWKAVVLNYMSDPLNQPEVVGFDATQVTPTGIFDVVLSALDVFNIQSISIIDFQGGVFTVPRSELTVAEFDVDMSGASYPFTRDFAAPLTQEANETTLGSGGSFTIGGGNLVINNVQFPSYSRDLSVDGLSVVMGQNYNARIYIVAATNNGGPTSGWVLGMGSSGGNLDTSLTVDACIAAIGSYVDVPLTGIANGVNNFSFGYGSPFVGTVTISKIIISEV